MTSFEDVQQAIKMSSKVFDREALQDVYKFFTNGSDSKRSFKFPCCIPRHPEETWCTIDAGVSAALRVVEEEFEGRDSKDSVQEYLEALADGKNRTQMLISVRGTHHPFESSVIESGKGLSLIKIIILILHRGSHD
jgi:hypothetical protein